MDLLLIFSIALGLYVVTVLPCGWLFIVARRRWPRSNTRPIGLAALAGFCFSPVLLDGHVPGFAPLPIALLLRVMRGQRFDVELAFYAVLIVFTLALALLWRAHSRLRERS